MTEEEREAQKAYFRGRIAYYSGIKEELETCKSELYSVNHRIFEGVSSPMIGYDMKEGNMWQGHNYDIAKELLQGCRDSVRFFRGKVSEVIGEISDAIADIDEKLEELEANLAALG